MDVALNKESKRKTPTVIAFRDGQRVFGEDAVNVGLRFPANSFYYLPDLLGKTIDHPVVETYRKRFPHYNIEADPERNTVVFRVGDDKYSVEELVAQLIQKAREFAEQTSGQPINECTIVVPGFYGQPERMALLTAANLANIKVLQLLNDYTAVALNFGLYKQTDFNETAQYYVFYDMGAYKTTAAVVSYQLVRDKVTRENQPVVQVLGVGYDRTLGGLEMQLRLRDYLAKEFNKLKKTKTDIFTNPRAMMKLLKEAGRVKNVLSANKDHFAQIEGLLDEKDFKHQVTREEFENFCADLFQRVNKPLDDALKASALDLSVIKRVVLFGGAVRTPKVQEILEKHINQELGKSINMDEAAAIGSVYKAADLATGFKVRKYVTKDAVLYPIVVTFEREGNSGSKKIVKRPLFTAMASYPQKKVITFNKNSEDFEFEVIHDELQHLPESEIKNLSKNKLLKIKLKDVAKTLEANQGENVESKGIKAHFTLDDSGLFSLSGVELVLEKQVTESDEESSLSKLGNTISKLFSSSDDEGKKETEGKTEEGDTEKTTEGENTESNEAKKDEKIDEQAPVNATADAGSEAAANKTVEAKPKIVTVKEPISNELEILHTIPLKGDRFEESRKKIEKLNEVERQIFRREVALNSLESFIIETQEKLDNEEYSSCGQSDEIESIRSACKEVAHWLDEDGYDSDAETFEKKLNELQEKTNPLYARHWEHNERPDALKALDKLIVGAHGFLKTAKNLTKEVNPDKDVYTPVELETLEKAITDTESWANNEQKKQNDLNRFDEVQLTVKSITDKMSQLDREVKYLVSKLKIWKPKLKPKKENATKEATGDEEKVVPETIDEEGVKIEEVPETDDDTVNPTPTEGEEEFLHSEL